ncbi:MAG: long-chain fatty acid--CoA ligase [Ignavibacteria bacterium]|nr:long-chain fatty acid--CoA ligase [Ignavibacteria bacterium]
MKRTLTSALIEKFQKTGLVKEVFFTKEDDEYIPFSNGQILQQTGRLIKYFEKKNLKKGDKVAIISENRTEWVVTDFACMFCGLISIPVYTSQSHAQLQYILNDSESQICFLSGFHLLEKVLQIKNDLISLKEIVTYQEIEIDRYKIYDSDMVRNYDGILFDNSAGETDDNYMNLLEKYDSEVKSEDTVSVVYTSGTTGIPKGVMLTHNNYCSNVEACQKVLQINDKDSFLSYLPYSHSYERTAGYYLPFFCGAKIYYAQNFDTIAVQLQEVKPTFVITVPRLLDKFYNKLMKSGMESESLVKRVIFSAAKDIAVNKKIKKGSFRYKIADKLVFKKIREKTGGNIRFFVSGGGALNTEVGEFFDRIGLCVLEGYGLTETSPVISVNRPEKNKFGTVGKPLDGVNVKISGEGEIIVKGELVMKGYFKDKKSTEETIIDGWLYTGDLGEIDTDGYIKITDRKKSLIKTSGGKYIAPTQIENLISTLSYVENVVIIGNERLYVTALIVPDRDELKELAGKNNIEYSLYSDILTNKKILEIIKKDIDRLQADLAPYERVKKFTLLEKHFSIESGELTPTLKVKRKVIDRDFNTEIEKMYNQ